MRCILGFTILVTTAFGTAFGQCSDADKRALVDFHNAFETAYQTGDKAALTAFVADDFVAFPSMGGKAGYINAAMAVFERSKTNPQAAVWPTRDRFMVSCTVGTATITHRNTVLTPNSRGGKPETIYSRSLHFLEKSNGKWQVVTNAGHPLDDLGILWYLEQDWNDAILKRDKAWFEQNFASDFSGVDTMTGKLSNKSEDIAGTVNDKGTMDLAETTNVNVRVDGNAAIVTGTHDNETTTRALRTTERHALRTRG